MGNLKFIERFNGTLSDWTLDQTGGVVSIVTQDYSTKMKLDDTGGSAIVSAMRNFIAPSEKYIIEFDVKVAISAICKISIRDSSNNNVIDLDIGSTSNTFSFDTDSSTPSTTTWNNGVYKQVVIVVDPIALTSKCYISEDDSTYGSLQQVGSTKSYSNVVLTNLIFYTTSVSTGIVYVDEVRLYTPDWFFIGDSIVDGKLYWSSHPEYPAGRLAAQEDETSSPNYKCAGYIDSNSTTWISNRAFGGTNISGVDGKIQIAVLDHGAKKVFICIGHNDIYPGTGVLSTMKTTFDSTITKIQNAGVANADIYIGGVLPSGYIDTTAKRGLRYAWNDYLYNKAVTIGGQYIDLSRYLASSEDVINTSYDDTDGVHLVPAGNDVYGKAISYVINFKSSYQNRNVLRSSNGVNDERLSPSGALDINARLWWERQKQKNRASGRIR